ncbi:trifunctional MMPL family transporter/lysophospholipid acyltransferase/class I SAM-dependent methyltransferase [uncultured Chitinophaga sp.]|uniref:trifunctional MMPL family transporter/lysophospholipid acyltransferase/class I SAM-dependent methyltransferase n=1 Tax=uncultured Chitinophaga sp. TaxID=339340 RepID=UPI0025DE0F72|nr:trifunctional MMPL family transporter/lysophospholipid acyltransferase/class I SAM-dependent methyltransferase [uncultured Chitinophaga sp.]
MGIFFISIYNFFEKRKPLLWLFTILSFALAAFFASRIRLEEDITRILPRDKKIDRLQQFLQSSKFADKLVVTISQKDTTASIAPDSLTEFATSLSEQLRSPVFEPYIKTLQAQTEDAAMLELMGTIRSNLPVFLEAQDYGRIDTLLTPAMLKEALANNYNTLISPAGLVLKQMVQQDPVGISWLGVKKLMHLQYDDQFDLYDNFVVTKDYRHLMIFITPANPPGATGKNALFLKELDKSLDSLQVLYPGTEASYFGATAVSVGNAQQLRHDTIFTQGITVVLLIILIALFFRRKRAPVLVMMPVVFGALFSLAVVYLVQGSISVIALGGGCVVLGIAVNYSLHIFNHYRHLPDIRQVIKDLAIPMTVGGLTTIGGFLCLQFVKSPMLQDIGLFAAFCLVGAALFSLIFLPHFIVLGKQPKVGEASHNIIDRLAEYRPERNKYLVYGILALTVVFFFTARKVSFESDMMRMNFMQPKLKVAEDKLNRINQYTAQNIYLISEGKNLDEALQHREDIEPLLAQLSKEQAVKKVSGVNGLMLSEAEQRIRINRWNAYWTKEKKQQLLADLHREAAEYKFKPEAFAAFENLLNKQYEVLKPEASGLMQTGFLSDFITEKPGSASIVTILKADPAKKAAIYAALDGREHTVIFDKQYTANRLAELIQEEFNSIAWMTATLVFLALLISYGRIELALITFIPMALSWVWILGIMGLFGIKFNIVNIILSTFIFGLGDDYSIFTMDGLLQEYRSGSKHLPSFKSSIFFSAITTILGLGVLIFAEHPSLRSIALIAIIGISCVVLISQVMIPFFFNWLITNRVKKGRAPWTLHGWVKSVFSMGYFVFGSLLMTVIGWIFLRLNPVKSLRIKYLYHVLLSKYTWSVLYIMGNFKKRIINEPVHAKEKPAIIISNHQSFLDILVSTMLNPRVVLLTNEWVWKSPVFGAVVRMADYYPVAEGAEGSVEKLRTKVQEGYSIVIYPEGTRSPDGTIKRFHKGAFYLAEQLQLDVQPVLIHGTGYTMSKSDFLLKDGTVSVKYLPRISHEDKSWGEGYAARTKSISRHFKKEYESLRSETETPRYFREQLIYNYIYKGPVLEWYMRIKTKMENNYELFNQLVPKQGKVLDIGCGYGFLSYMLHWVEKGREVTGLDYDEDKIATANHCYLRNDNVNFIHADATTYAFGPHDAFIISDVLHYLRPEAQELLITRCIQQLNPDGIIIIRDGNAELEERHKGTKLTELFSTKLFGFNKTENELSFLKASTIKELAAKHGVLLEQIDNTKFTSNIIFVLKHQHAHV